MSLLAMSIQGGVMVAVITLLRAVTLHRVPKRTFLILWGAVLARLLIPFSLPSGFSIYSLLARKASSAPAAAAAVPAALPLVPVPGQAASALPAHAALAAAIPVWGILWGIGTLLCAAIFAAAYWRCCREFQMSLPVDSETTRNWLAAHPLRRRVALRQSDRISSPLTFGVLRPVILLPKHTDWNDTPSLFYVFEHEFVHIQRFDTLAKLFLAAAVCLHWWNPLVWGMYVLANRDIELSCDETVLRRLGGDRRASYAKVLIRLAERRSRFTPLCSHFSQTAMEERITAIMKIKKTTMVSLLLAAALIAGTVTVFATSAQESTKGAEQKPDTEITHTVGNNTAAQPDAELLAAGLTYQNGTWSYQGKAVAGMYDDNGGIYTNDAAASDVYLAIKRGSDGKINELAPITKKEFRKLVDKHMNLMPTETTAEEETLLSYVDPADGKTYYSFDDGKTFQPLTDAEFEALYPTPDIEWWTYDEFKAWLDEEKVQLQGMLGEKGWTGGEGAFVWTQEKIDETIALYESILADIKNGIMYSKTVDGQDAVMMSYNPADISTSTDEKGLYVKLDNGQEKTFGPYATDEELFAAVRSFCEEQVRLGNLKQNEAEEILRSIQPENP